MTGGSPEPGPAPRADAIVVAAGSSQRMNGLDKLAVPIAGRPLLAWAVAALAAAPEVERIVVVTAESNVAAVRTALWLPAKVVAVVAGAGRRQESVAAGFAALEQIDADGGPGSSAGNSGRVVLIHDGARPLASPALVAAVASAASLHGAAIPVLPVAETLKRIEAGRIAGTVDRSGLAAAQTPQGIRREILRDAYRRVPPSGPAEFTDEAALLEACRIPVHAVPGEPANLKVTVPDDLARAAALLDGPRAPRYGIGADRHPFGPGSPLALGGIEIAGAPRLHGHSDGDVALHALADALLGAAGLGDLGRLFPADERTPTGIASRDLLAEVLRRVAAAGFRPTSADLTIVGSRPRLAGRLDLMRDEMAGLLGIDPSAVNVKASTGNLGGDEGAGRGLSATAIASLERAR